VHRQNPLAIPGPINSQGMGNYQGTRSIRRVLLLLLTPVKEKRQEPVRQAGMEVSMDTSTLFE